MVDHIAEQIMAAFVTLLTGLTTTDSNITRDRVYTIDEDELPHLSIFQGLDIVEPPDGEDEATNIYFTRQLEAVIQITCDATSGALSTTVNLIRKEIHAAIQGDLTLSGLCINIAEQGITRPELSDERKKRTATAELTYIILYRHTRAAADA